MSSITAWERGARAAPQMPWKTRKNTICSSVWAAPQSIEVLVKPTMAKTKRFFRPKRCETQPTGAVMMAEAQGVGEKLGVQFKIGIDKRIAGAQAVGAHKTSMLQDIEAGKALELEALSYALRNR